MEETENEKFMFPEWLTVLEGNGGCSGVGGKLGGQENPHRDHYLEKSGICNAKRRERAKECHQQQGQLQESMKLTKFSGGDGQCGGGTITMALSNEGGRLIRKNKR